MFIVENKNLIVFGPVPSRRLGRSLGINNIPPKICTYSCSYCQLGVTKKKSIEKQQFYEPSFIYEQVKSKIEKINLQNEVCDYLTFVPDGEPTLDNNLKEEIQLLKTFQKPLAVITNSSMLWDENVRQSLLKTDLVSIKVDAITETLWRKIDHPHKLLNLESILEGIQIFSNEFKGKILTETMLLNKINYSTTNEFLKIATFIKSLKNIEKAYISIPTRPPALNWAVAPSELIINQAYQEFTSILGNDKVEYLIGYEGNAFAHTGDVITDILSITSVHPMRKSAVEEFLKVAKEDWKIIEKLLKEKKLVKIDFENKEFFMRKLHKS